MSCKPRQSKSQRSLMDRSTTLSMSGSHASSPSPSPSKRHLRQRHRCRPEGPPNRRESSRRRSLTCCVSATYGANNSPPAGTRRRETRPTRSAVPSRATASNDRRIDPTTTARDAASTRSLQLDQKAPRHRRSHTSIHQEMKSRAKGFDANESFGPTEGALVGGFYGLSTMIGRPLWGSHNEQNPNKYLITTMIVPRLWADVLVHI